MDSLNTDTDLTKIEDPLKIKELKLQFLGLMSPGDWNQDQDLSKVTFPGSSPSMLSRKDFNYLRRRDYWVCEKSEGIRALVLFLSEGIYLFHDETFEFYYLPLDKLILTSASNPVPQHLTLLDVEIAHNYHYNKQCLMILDVIMIEGTRITDLPLSKRLRELRDKIITPFRNRYQENFEDASYILLGKEYLKLKDIQKLISKVQHFNEEDETGNVHRYLYKSEKRYNDSLGFYFVSESKGYTPWDCISSKVWVWPFLFAATFQIRLSKKKNGKYLFKLFSRMSQEENSTLIEYKIVYFSKESTKKLLSQIKDDTEAIIDCGYDKSQGEWVFFNLSSKQPNTISNVAQKLEVIAENIQREDLIQLSQNSNYNRPHTTPHVTMYPPSIEKKSNESSPENKIDDSPPTNGHSPLASGNESPIYGTKRVHDEDSSDGERKKLKQ